MAIRSLTASRAINLSDFKNYTPSILKILCIFYDLSGLHRIKFTLLTLSYVKITSFSILPIVSKKISDFQQFKSTAPGSGPGSKRETIFIGRKPQQIESRIAINNNRNELKPYICLKISYKHSERRSAHQHVIVIGQTLLTANIITVTPRTGLGRYSHRS